MMFSSYSFILGFLPVTLLVYFFISTRFGSRSALAVLVGASIVFYGWWSPSYTLVLLLSVLFNYSIGLILWKETGNKTIRRYILITGITINLAFLGYYKYAGFLFENVNQVFDVNIAVTSMALPLAISFFTFQQIAYIIDSYKGLTSERSFLSYCLFVTFFPQLIAGPIVHHKEMMPQFRRSAKQRLTARNLSIGLTILSIGLFKKLIIADNLADISDDIFGSVAMNKVSFLESWLAALAYTGQIYFDFSAYSDMATGLARMFGIRLPVNFLSPYKAASIINFWQRWHITLSRFLRDYLYIPLGGSRRGHGWRVFNIMTVMVLGGLWHGASWTFVAWGALHGLFILINHTWRLFRPCLGLNRDSMLLRWGGVLLTFVCVTVAWVFFRAPSFGNAYEMLRGMAGLNGIVLPGGIEAKLGSTSVALKGFGVTFGTPGSFTTVGAAIVLISFAIIWMFPNTYEITRSYKPILRSSRTLCELPWSAKYIRWRPSLKWALFISFLLLSSLISMGSYKDFLYFNF